MALLGSLLIVILITFTLAPSVQAWAQLGHQVTADIASNMLTDDANYMVNFLLSDVSMSDVSMWADDIKSNATYNWTSTYHTATIAESECSFVQERDCPANDCVPNSVLNYSMRLGDENISLEEQNFALKMIIHLYGDIHQPMNIAYASDNHGLDDHGLWFNTSTNLQVIFQQSIIQREMEELYNANTTQFVNGLLQQFNATSIEKWTTCPNNTDLVCPIEWASESALMVYSDVYFSDDQGSKINKSTNFTLGDVYYALHRDDLHFRLIMGGVRLANVLNVIGSTWKLPRSDQGHFGVILVSALSAGTAVAAAGAILLWWWRSKKNNHNSLFKHPDDQPAMNSPTGSGDYSRMADE